MTLQQAQVHANRVHLVMAGYIQYAVQQAAAFRAGDGDVQIAPRFDRVFGQHGIAVVAVRVNRIATVGKIVPHAVGQKLVLRHGRPLVVARGVFLMLAEHFLQKHQIGPGTAHGVAQLRQDETSIEGGKPFVGVDGQHLHAVHGRRCQRSRGFKVVTGYIEGHGLSCAWGHLGSTHAETDRSGAALPFYSASGRDPA